MYLLRPGDQRLGNAADLFYPYLVHAGLEVRVVRDRSTKSGDFRYREGKRSVITINDGLGDEAFLIILAHEIAHFEARSIHGMKALPHGTEWKAIFSGWLLRLVETGAFRAETAALVTKHAFRPRASLSADKNLWMRVNGDSMGSGLLTLDQLPEGATFMLNGKRTFRKMKRRRTRYACMEIPSGRIYVVHGQAPVKMLET